MRVLYVGMAHDYGDPARGPSFEETNFRSSLEGMGHDVIAFDFMARERAVGREAMRAELVGAADGARPDVVFLCLFTDEIDVRTLEALRRAGGAPTVNWFADDHWRFDDFTRHYAPALDLAVTTDHDTLPKYAAAGIRNVHLSQWACNRYAYTKVTDALEHEVTFVGQPYGTRESVIERLRAAGHHVETWGHGWPEGRLDHDGMVRVFSTSRINLNLAGSFAPPRPVIGRLRTMVGLPPGRRRPPQIKGRNFEVPGCGGFLLTERLAHLDQYFDLGREIAVYDREDDIVDLVAHWLANEEERAAVARAGYERVLAEHTYDHRFAAIFAAMGLS